MLVLLVDDHALLREGLALLMRQRFEQLQLLEASSLGEACICLAEHPAIELVLLDLSLRDSQGLASLTRVRRVAPRATVVVLSADTRHDTMVAAIRAGASGFIPKTARGGVIETALHMVLQGHVYLPADLLQVGAVDPAGELIGGPPPGHQADGPARGRSGAGAAQPPGGEPRLVTVPREAAQSLASQLGLAPRQADVLRLLLEGLSNKAIGRELDLAESTVKSHTIAIFRKLNVGGRAEAMVHAAQLGLYGGSARHWPQPA
ncbi:MAG: response regulator transcription factor [Burkholderiales bacterium]|nr:response regulator transcription factor [Burkholderiales bacterium]